MTCLLKHVSYYYALEFIIRQLKLFAGYLKASDEESMAFTLQTTGVMLHVNASMINLTKNELRAEAAVI
jgi:hypothetical protein